MTTDMGRIRHLTKHEARQRLEHERSSRLVQLRAIEESAPYADEDLQAAQTAAIGRVLEEIDAAGRASGRRLLRRSAITAEPPPQSSVSRSCLTPASAWGASNAPAESRVQWRSCVVTHQISAADNRRLEPAQLTVLRASMLYEQLLVPASTTPGHRPERRRRLRDGRRS